MPDGCGLSRQTCVAKPWAGSQKAGVALAPGAKVVGGANGMTDKNPRAICIGEVVIELARGTEGRFALACGGDMFNTPIDLARAGIGVAFATALGDDPYSDSAVALAAAEGVASNLMLRVPGRLPALCLIETPPPAEDRTQVGGGGAGARTVRAARLDANC